MDKDSEIRTFFAHFLHIISKHFIYLIMFAFFSPQKKREKKRIGKQNVRPNRSLHSVRLTPPCMHYACLPTFKFSVRAAPDIPVVHVQRSFVQLRKCARGLRN